ncbi:MAG: hypothetical protein L0G70_06455 [Rubrobacter sp.]|nr:hypothetical protein [Rubrobacter sp.]
MRAGDTYPDFGALVISLDFELHWGVRDLEGTDGPYAANLRGEWEAIPRILEAFREFEVSATWATVGFLFAGSRDEIERYSPQVRPEYLDASLDAYRQRIGRSESDDPLHYAPSLIEQIRRCPGQEMATHTFSHYYCLEPGQDRDSFRADIESACALAADKGFALESIVFPRNQCNPDYEDILRESGIRCYRGNQSAWMYGSASRSGNTNPARRICRLADTYLNIAGHHTTGWGEIEQDNELCNVPASFYVRPYSPRMKSLEDIRLGRIERALGYAAESGELLHLWWHPHDFGVNIDENIAFLKRILRRYRSLHDSHGMKSLSMSEAAGMACATKAKASAVSGVST